MGIYNGISLEMLFVFLLFLDQIGIYEWNFRSKGFESQATLM